MDNGGFKTSTWQEQARSDWHAMDVFRDIDPAQRLIDALFFGTRYKPRFFGTRPERYGAIGCYLELWSHDAQRQLVLRGYAYALAHDDVNFDGKATARSVDWPRAGAPQSISLPLPAIQGAYQFHVQLSCVVRAEGLAPAVASASARLDKHYARSDWTNLRILPARWPDRDHNLVIDGKLHGGGDWFCPNCGGLGAFKTMAIPKADWESGATGYHLYACNKVNGIEACTVCGGSGGVYERWYVKEHPELRKIAFTRGSGLVSAQRPAPA